jgi:hypothetical protein
MYPLAQPQREGRKAGVGLYLPVCNRRLPSSPIDRQGNRAVFHLIPRTQEEAQGTLLTRKNLIARQATLKSVLATKALKRDTNLPVGAATRRLYKKQFMRNENEKDFQQQQPKPTETVNQSKKNPSHDGRHSPNQQDPSKKNPSYGDDSRQRDGEEGSGQVEKRHAS